MTERLWRGIIWPKPEYTDPEVLWEILTVPCGDCGGTGLMVTPVPFPEHKSCPSCDGTGRTLREDVLGAVADVIRQEAARWFPGSGWEPADEADEAAEAVLWRLTEEADRG